ncbi:hypothetical protein [Acutalibacter muris]|jgi:hypothetical protein|uniref:hypothetical protein n=1 Tax=Acutalibacter muris TaxID=1796620 RepID=UPI0026F3809A|nr:hypothetical protein [Acutalibacter muris]
MKKWKKALMMCVVAMLIISLSIIAYAKFAVPTFPSNLPELNPHELDFDVPQTLSNNESNINDESDISVPMAKDALPISTKEEVFDRMLNSIDYFNTAQICFDLLMSPVEEPITCIIETNLVTGESYEATVPLIAGAASIDGALAEVETYSDGDNITNYYNKKKEYCVMFPAAKRMLCEQELPKDLPRAFIGTDDNMPNYINRVDSTNTTFGSYCLFPQGLTFGFLTDFSLWNIDGNEKYLDRDCLALSGNATESYGQKLNIETFSMLVDSTTGILLKLEGRNQRGEITAYMTVNSIVVDGPATQAMGEHDMSKYTDYTEISNGILFE